MNQYGQITPWWVQQNQQRAAMTAQQTQTPMNWQQPQPGWSQPQMQNQQQFGRPVPSSIPGRIIQNPMEITPEEVPMNGTVSLFPSTDYSYIIAKQWNQNGTIDTLRFVPEPQVVNQETATELDPFKKEVIDRLDKLENLLSPAENTSNAKAKQTKTTKQEENTHE